MTPLDGRGQHRGEDEPAARAPSPSEDDDEYVWQSPVRPRWRTVDKVVFVLILVATAGLYFARLGEPSKLLTDGFKSPDGQCVKWPTYKTKQCWEMIPLDEVHYVPDSRDVLRFGTESDTRVPTSDDGSYVVHPPAGKWFVAIGIWLFGDEPFGWRFFGAVFGVLGVMAMYMLARRLFRSPWWAAMAAAMLALDGLWFVQSRVAMLDIYAAAPLLAGVWMIVEDRDRTSPNHRGHRWWRLGAGACFGLAVASKYPVETMLFIFVAAIASLRWDAAKAPLARKRRRAFKRLVGGAGTFILIPAVAYVASFTPWFLDAHRYNPPRCENLHGPRFMRAIGLQSTARVLEQWGCYQVEILDFHRHLAKYETATQASPTPSASTSVVVTKPAHPYFGNGITWPWIGRPVAHYFSTIGPKKHTRDVEVVGIPNPAIWWFGFVIALPLLLWWTWRRNDNLAPLLLAFFLAGWLPYVLADAIKRPVFMFYATPLVPFIVLSVVHVWRRFIGWLPEVWLAPIVYVVLVAAVFAYFYPILAGYPISPSGFFGWGGHMWLQADCAVENRIKVACWI